ncbi:MAG: YbaB/EbfC family nucleoid-associated protein [Candidatus Muiribacterium halophilum]|uniref:Nucleoid-associated protein C0601_09930 n=1 Tax=Muiribacterium halophilum TaxID=2053465 RepID=A0A2N5ZD43_MUIH1|nr:MAG: YbaB/EbfC family nucleoid-associated protein [Candidatus Muirbacterium halophilum]
MGKRPNFGGGNMQNLMKQAQKMQKEMAKAQEALKDKEVEGSAGGQMVKVIMTCSNEVKEVIIDKEVIDPDDQEMLQDLIAAAFNDAVKKAAEESERSMSKLTGGMNIPGLF